MKFTCSGLFKLRKHIVYLFSTFLGVAEIFAATPMITFDPADGATDVLYDKIITITFDQAVRNINNSPITDGNVDGLIIFKETNASGADVPFDATINGGKTIITITPDANLLASQVYFLEIAPVENSSDEATSTTSITFTTAAAPTFTQGPTLLDFTGGNDGMANDFFDINYELNETGTLYFVTVNDPSITPTAGEVKAGTAAGGGAPASSGSFAFTAGSPDRVTATADDLGGYDVYIVAGNGMALTTVQVFNAVGPDNQSAPIVTTTGGNTSFTEDGGSVTVDAGVTVSDSDDTDIDGGTVTITNVLDAGMEVLAATGVGSIVPSYSEPTLTLSGAGTVAEYQQVLQSVTYNNTSQAPDETNRTIEFVVNDGVDDSNMATKTVTVSAVNDDPVLNLQSTSETVDEEGTLTFNSGNSNLISVTDIDAGVNDIEVTMSVMDGVIDIQNGDLSALTSSSGDGTANVTLTGTLANVNTALDGMQYEPNADFFGNDDLVVDVSDLGSTGSGGAKNDNGIVMITVNNLDNDPPVNSVPGTQNAVEDTDFFFSSGNGNAITVSDPDAMGADIEMMLTVTDGTITLGTTAGIMITGGADGSATVTFTGTTTEINTAMDGMFYSPTMDFTGTATLDVDSDDLGNTGTGGAQTDSDNVDIDVAPGNDPPSITLQSAAETVNEGASLTFNAANSNLITISDPDAGGNDIELTLTVSNGTVDLAGGDPPAALNVTGGADLSATVTVEGTVSELNTALDGLIYTPDLNFSGNDNLQINVDDLGNVGAGPDGTDNASIGITVNNADNDPPVNNVPGTQNTDEETSLIFSSGNGNAITVTDFDAGSSDIQVDLSVPVGEGTLTLATTAGLTSVIGNGTNAIQMTGPISDINAAMDGLDYSPPVDFTAGTTFTIISNDLGKFVDDVMTVGTPLTDTDNITININPVNDPPVISSPGVTQNVNEEASLAFNGNISVSDVDIGGGDITVDLTATDGVVNFPDGDLGALTSSSGEGTSSVTLTGTLANVNIALDGMTYTGILDFNGAATLTIDADDNDNTGSEPPDGVDNAVVNINVIEVNDKPTFTASDPPTVPRISSVNNVTVPGWVTNFDAGPPDEEAIQNVLDYIVTNIIDGGNILQSNPAVDASGQLTYSIKANQSGTVDFDVQVRDDGGTPNGGVDISDPQTFTITVLAPDATSTFADAGGTTINIDYDNFQEPNALTNGNSVSLFDFTIDDADSDPFVTELNSLTLDIVNIDFLRRLAIFDGTTPIGADLDVQANRVGNTLTFTGLSEVIADEGSQTLKLKASFTDNVIDNDQIQITITGATAAEDGSQFDPNTFPVSSSIAGANENKVEVTATNLVFTVNPPASIFVGQTFSPELQVEAQDALGSVDKDYEEPVGTLNTGGVTFENPPTGNYVQGVKTFPGNFAFLATGTGVTITVPDDPGGIAVTNAVSSSFDISAAADSRVDLDPAFSFPDDIFYINHQATDIDPAGNPGGDIVIAQFLLIDGFTPTINDFDNAGTELTQIEFEITKGAPNIRNLALYDEAGNELGEFVNFTGTTANFTGFSATAPDDGTLQLELRASFKTVVTDNDNIELSVTSITGGSGSQLIPIEGSVNGFSGVFDPSNWTQVIQNADGAINTTGAPGQITLTGGNDGTPPGTEILTNGSFEGTLSGWAASSGWTLRTSFFDGFNTILPFSGSWFTSINSSSGTRVLFQDVTIPAGVSSANLSGRYRVTWNVTTCDDIFTICPIEPTARVQIRNTSGIVLQNIQSGFTPFYPGTGDTGWVFFSVNVAGFAGSTIRVYFEMSYPQVSNATMAVDNVSLAISDTNPGNTDLTINMPVDGTVDFDWDYNTADGRGPDFDPAFFLLNGGTNTLSTSGGGTPQNGSQSVPVNAGNSFGYRVNTTDGHSGAATLDVSNFTFTLPPVVTPTGKNNIRVVASQAVYTNQPDNIIGINEDFTSVPTLEARDANDLLDVDFAETVTITTPDGLTPTSPPAAFAAGLLDFTGFQYQDAGDGTITVQTSSLPDATSNPVDVINTIAFHLNSPENNNVVSSDDVGTLPNGVSNVPILAFRLSTIPGTDNPDEPEFQEVTITFEDEFGNPQDIEGIFNNFRLLRSVDNKYQLEADFPALIDLPDPSGVTTSVTFPGVNLELENTTSNQNFFILVDIDPSVGSGTPAVTLVLTIDDIIVSSGTVTDNTQATGTRFTNGPFDFNDTSPPKVASFSPDSASINNDVNTDFSITFNEPVFPIGGGNLDMQVRLFEDQGDIFVDFLTLTNISGDNRTFTFTNPNPPLESNTDYYITFPEGDFANNFGVRDGVNLPFGGLLTPDSWPFKTADTDPPVFVTLPLSADNVTDISFNIKADLDEVGTVFYLVDEAVAGDPTLAQVRDPGTFSGEVAAGTIDISRANQFHFATVLGLTANTNYEVFMTAEDGAQPTPNQQTGFEKFSVMTSAPFGNGVVVEGPTQADICTGIFQPLFDPILIIEGQSDDFKTGSDVTYVIGLPGGFEFKTTISPNITIQGSDISGITSQFINASTLRLTYDIGGTSDRDLILIEGLEIKALGPVGINGHIERVGGNHNQDLNDEFENSHGFLNTTQSTISASFTTIPGSSTVTTQTDIVELVPDSDLGSSAFSGSGVFGSQLFTSLAGLGEHTITHTKTDQLGCTSKASKIISIVENTSEIPGLSLRFCFGDNAATVDADAIQFFELDTLLIELPDTLTAATDGIEFIPATGDFSFDPNAVEAGSYDFLAVYTFLFDQNQKDSLRQTVQVNIPPTVDLVSNTTPPAGISGQYCVDGEPVELAGIPEPILGISEGDFTFIGGNDPSLTEDTDGTASFDLAVGAANFGLDTVDIIYNFRIDSTGCSNSDTIAISINSKPKADFAIGPSCNGIPVQFTDLSVPTDTTTTADSIAGWMWDFGDLDAPLEEQTDSVQSPQHLFSGLGTFNVSLVSVSNFGCTSEQKDTTVTIGNVPTADFTVFHSNTTDPVLFENNSTPPSGTIIDSLIYLFGDGNSVSTGNVSDLVSHIYDQSGELLVSLVSFTAENCPDTATKDIVVVPLLTPEPANAYQENFESGQGGWVATGDNSSWGIGTASGNNIISNQSFNEANIWATNLTGSHNPEENSFVYSPAFDLRNLQRPLIGFDAIYQLAQSDGVVIQFSTDTFNINEPEKVWQVLGNVGSGIDWFNAQSILSNPGNQETLDLGWSGTAESGKWSNARHSLNVSGLPQEERDRVIFRFAFRTLAEQTTNDGFAFDNVRIAERQGVVLVEQFVNASELSEGSRMISQMIESDLGDLDDDFVLLNYHTDFPGEDPFNSVNQADPGGRRAFYNLGEVPYTIIDGGNGQNTFRGRSLNENNQIPWEDELALRSLKIPEVEIDINIPAGDIDELTVETTITANENIDVASRVQIAVIEKVVTGVNGGNGQSEFKNVLRKMLPDAGGTVMESGLAVGEVFSFSQTWKIRNVMDPSQLAVIVFVQSDGNSDTFSKKEIFQARIVDISGKEIVTGVEEFIDAFTSDIILFPNPANDELQIIFPQETSEVVNWKTIGLNGVTMTNGNLGKGVNSFTIDTSQYPSGVYTLYLENNSSAIIYRKFIVTH